MRSQKKGKGSLKRKVVKNKVRESKKYEKKGSCFLELVEKKKRVKEKKRVNKRERRGRSKRRVNRRER